MVEERRKAYFNTLFKWLEEQRQHAFLNPLYLHQTYYSANRDCHIQNHAKVLSERHLQSQLAQLQQQQQLHASTGNLGPQPTAQLPRQHELHGGRLGVEGYRFKVPPIWKRLLAEFIDGLILLIFKIFLMIIFEKNLDFLIDSILPVDTKLVNSRFADAQRKHVELIRKVSSTDNLEFDLGQMRISLQDLMSPQMIFVDFLIRLFVVFLESVCLCGCFGLVRGGYTPGKWLMKLQVLVAQEVIDLPDSVVEVIPAHSVCFQRALIRSAIKNLAMMFFFPVWATALVFSNHRASYDIISSTIVVENLPAEDTVN